MGWGDKINIMAAPLSQLDHHGGHLLRLYFHAFSQVTDIIILAKIAKQVART
jgi:hypothetical protein